MRWLLDHGADANARCHYALVTPLFAAAFAMQLEAVQILLEHNAGTNLQDIDGKTPLYFVLTHGNRRER
jgi:ankyrin repeat protein